MNKFKMPDFQFKDSITEEQLEFFNQYGIIQFKNFIDKETVSQFLDETALVQNELLKSDTKKVNGIPLKFGTDTDGSKLIQRIAFTSFYSEKLSTFLKGKKLEKILDLMGPYEGRIGENEKDGLVFNHYVNAADSKFTQLGWHTDSPRDLFLGTRILPMLNIGLHLDDCHSAHGGLRVIPGTHQQSLFSMLFRKKYFVDNKPDKKEAGFDIEAGDLTVHDGRLWHRVQQSSLTGAASRRRVLYFPAITGAYRPKNEHSATPFYHKLAQIKDQRLTGKLIWARLQIKAKKIRKPVNHFYESIRKFSKKENSQVHAEVIRANNQYTGDFGSKSALGLPPARKFAILTCMDARLDPAKYAGLSEGDAHVIRNAGGRASDDAIRSLVISYKLLGTREWFVIHHTDCGMELFTDDIIRNLLAKSLKTATVDSSGWKNTEESGGSDEARFISFLTIKNLAESVVEDVVRIRSHPLVPKDIPVYGYIYDVKTGKLIEVPQATKAGRAS